MNQTIASASLPQVSRAPSATGLPASPRGRRLLSAVGCVLAVTLGFAIGLAWARAAARAAAGAAALGSDADLVHLLRMMAALKLGMVAGAGWLVDWRLRASAPPQTAVAYGAALAAMAIAPGLIWYLAPVVAGAVAFHAGLVLMLVTAYFDRDGARSALAGRLARQPRP